MNDRSQPGERPGRTEGAGVIEPKEHEPEDEPVEHVDATGQVIEVVSRARMRSERLRHRCTYALVLRSSGELVVHQRAPWKSIYPSFWDVAFGGVCGVGESWAVAARRELHEEAGIRVDEAGALDLGPVRYEADDGKVLGRVFLVRSDEPVRPVDGEVVAFDEVRVEEIDRWMVDRSVCLDTQQAAWPVVRSHLLGAG